MRILVTSDSHGIRGNFFDVAEMHIDDTDLFINLGDSNSGNDLEDAKIYFKSKLRLNCVAGNCDFSSTEQFEKTITFAGKRIMFCHGHTLYVKHGIEMLVERAKNQGVDIALFGHTHIPFYQKIDGIHIFNPGALCGGCYGMIDITDDGIMCIHAKLQG